MKELLADPEVGWAGVLLYNERTHQLIDGHARRDVVPPDTLVPVLIGRWSEDGERKILATFDPVGSMAEADPDRLEALLEGISLDGEGLDGLLADLQAGLVAEGITPHETAGAPDKGTRETGLTVRCPKCGHRFKA